MRDGFAYALGAKGFEVFAASNGEDGIELAKEVIPHLVFLDLRMPGINGVETLRRLQAAHPNLPVYIVTAFRREFFEELAKGAHEGLRFNVADKPLMSDQIQLIALGMLGSGEE